MSWNIDLVGERREIRRLIAENERQLPPVVCNFILAHLGDVPEDNPNGVIVRGSGHKAVTGFEYPVPHIHQLEITPIFLQLNKETVKADMATEKNDIEFPPDEQNIIQGLSDEKPSEEIKEKNSDASPYSLGSDPTIDAQS